MNKQGTLVIGHGSKMDEVNRAFDSLIEILKKNTGKDVRGANLTSAKPTVDDIIKKMYYEGYHEIVVIPYFLSNGVHVVKNIPDILKNLEEKLPNLKFILKESLLLDEMVIKAVENKINS